ncbi:MAG: hypothetical protein IJM12_05905 [Bacteroidales bacterium]|nr:hypothetical protein [Bacteroidales bacterium]
MKRIILTIITLLTCSLAYPKQYQGSFFGMKSDGTTDNTTSFQKAMDWISTEHPGDTITLYVGRYLIGSVNIRSNVTLYLKEGAILVAKSSPYEYDSLNGITALLLADGVNNFHIFGQGVIEGAGEKTVTEINKLVGKGFLPKTDNIIPSLLLLNNCKDISIKDIIMQYPSDKAVIAIACKHIHIDNVTVRNDESAIFRNFSDEDEASVTF